MSSGNNNRESALAASNAAAQAQLAKTTAAYVPSPLETRLSKDSMDWMDFVDGKNGPVDYTKAPGLVHLGMYDQAATNRFAERTALTQHPCTAERIRSASRTLSASISSHRSPTMSGRKTRTPRAIRSLASVTRLGFSGALDMLPRVI
jgi:hypothetical protein